MVQEENPSGSRMTLEWVSCPGCSTTFRVAIPAHYEQMWIEYEESDDWEAWQDVSCPVSSCNEGFFLVFESNEADESS